MRPPGSAVGRVGSSGNRDFRRRLSGNAPATPRGGLAPFTLISRGLSEFGENGAYVERWGEICDPPGSVADRRGSSGNREISRESQKLTHSPRAVGLRHLL